VPKVLITSALPYANGPLHFGHIAGAYLPGDAHARFQRLLGSDVLYICGSDEFGFPITINAESAGRTPQQHVDIFHAVIKELFGKLDFTFDHYSRTTWPGHVETVQQFFLELLENGHIEEKVTDQLYSEKDGRFLADRYVIGTCPKCGHTEARGDECPKCGASYEATDLKEPRSKVSNAPLSLRPTKHWFMRFDHFKEPLSEWIKEKNWKPNVINFAKAYIDDLRPRAITRDATWGIPVPLDGAEGKVLYVWFDAPIGYISATREWAQQKGQPEKWKDYWLDPKTQLINFIGKDNIPFHAVFFPAMIMGQNESYKLVDELPANEFLNLEGRQFSKSEGWTIDLERFFEEFTSDQIRYYLAANAPETQDAEFSWHGFQNCCNSELVGKWGNLANRTLVFAGRQCEGLVPEAASLEAIDQEFLQKIETLSAQIKEAYARFSTRKVAQLIMELASAGNVYFDAKKPWAAAKDPSTRPDMETTVYCCIQCLSALSLVSFPLIPAAAESLFALVGGKTPLSEARWDAHLKTPIAPKTVLPTPMPLFKKIEDAVIEKELSLLEESKKPDHNFAPLKEQIGFEDFMKLDLRVGVIKSVEPVPKSKKLLKLIVDIGFEERTIVSGIAAYFDDIDALIGKKVTVVANLKPAKLMGVESQGMILAAGSEERFELLSLSEVEPGDLIS
jgi:methionyl-tRNA synthetase